VLPDSVSLAEDRGSTLSQFASAKMRNRKTMQNISSVRRVELLPIHLLRSMHTPCKPLLVDCPSIGSELLTSNQAWEAPRRWEASSTADSKSSRSIRISQPSFSGLQQTLNQQSRAARPAAGHCFGRAPSSAPSLDPVCLEWRPAADGRRPVGSNCSATCRKRRETACSPLLRACRPAAAGTRSDSDGCANDGVGVCEQRAAAAD